MAEKLSTSEQYAGLAAGTMLALGGPVASSEECEHRFQVGVNSHLAVCLICRERIRYSDDEPCLWGIVARGV